MPDASTFARHQRRNPGTLTRCLPEKPVSRPSTFLVLLIGLIALLSGDLTASSAIQVKVHFKQPLALPGVTEAQLLSSLQTDLNDEFASFGLTFIVQSTTSDYGALAQAAVASLSESVGYTDAKDYVRGILLTSPEVADYIDPNDVSPSFAEALQTLADSESAFISQLAAATNLAGVPGGSFAFVVTPAVVDGGMTKVGERWSELRAGQAPVIFPSPAELAAGSPGVNIDFTAPAFNPYRALYDDARRSAYQLQHLVNNAKHTLGLVLGRPENTGPLSDAMRGGLNYQMAEHFARSGAPVHYNATDRAAIASSLMSLLNAVPPSRGVK